MTPECALCLRLLPAYQQAGLRANGWWGAHLKVLGYAVSLRGCAPKGAGLRVLGYARDHAQLG